MNDENPISRYVSTLGDFTETAQRPIDLFGVILTITVMLGVIQLVALAFSDLSRISPHVWFALGVTIVAIGVSSLLVVEERAASAPGG
jgi:hypothetical protein